jgi:hypothetical protein
MYGPIKKVAKQSGYTENNATPFLKTFEEHIEDADNPGAKALAPLLRFCGGKSKPYKKK